MGDTKMDKTQLLPFRNLQSSSRDIRCVHKSLFLSIYYNEANMMSAICKMRDLKV